MLGSLFMTRTMTVNASAAATAWLNAFLATGDNPARPVLNATLSVEFFPTGVQFISCDGTVLFRTWVADHDTEHDWPEEYDLPEFSIVVMDPSHFALGFMRTLAAATKDFEVAELALSIESAPEQDGEAPLGANFSKEVLTLRALGQQLHCRLFEAPYINWRNADFGMSKAERVDGMQLSTRMFQTVGKLKGIFAVNCTFTGDNQRIIITGDRSVRGLLMPMARPKKDAAEKPDDDEQTDALAEDTKVKVDGRWVPATEANVAKAAGLTRGGRDRAAGREE